MCLYSKTKKPLVAKKNLICYKRVINLSTKPGTILTPFQGVELSCNSLIFGKGDSTVLYSKIDNLYHVNGGYFHAYQDYKTAIRNILFIDGSYIVKCIIPKGAKFYLGMDGDICASKIIIGTEIGRAHV